MQRVGGNGSSVGSSRPRKEKRLTYVMNGANDSKHCSSINCLSVLKSSFSDGNDYLFTGSRDGTVKRWALAEEEPYGCSTTFESHVDWVNDVVIVGDKTLISCSSDATLKTWDCFGDGSCSRTLRQHSDYVTCLATSEQNSNCVASGGLGGEIFMWDFEASPTPVAQVEDDYANVSPKDENSPSTTNSCSVTTRDNISGNSDQSHDYIPISSQGYKKSVYALAMNGSGTLLVSGGTDKFVRVWDPRAGSKAMKLKGHTDNIRALLLDSTGRFCLSGSSDSMIRLWDLGQQRCVHSYAVHTDSVWALASTPTFSHVYSGGRDMSLYLTDLTNRESLLLCTKENPIQQLAIHDDDIWIASTDSSIEKWQAQVSNPHKLFENGSSSFLTRSFSRAKVSLDGLNPSPVYKEPICTILGVPAIEEYQVLNTKRHVLTKDIAGSVKLWEITRGVVVEDYGKVSFEEKKEELDMTATVPAWFTVDARLGCLSINLDMPQCFSAEAQVADHKIAENVYEDKVNLGQETLRGLFAHWSTRRMRRADSEASTNIDTLSGTDISSTTPSDSRLEDKYDAEDDISVHPLFNFSNAYISIITEGSKGGLWRKKIADLDGSEDEKDFPWWCFDCVLNNRIPSKENNCGLPIKLREGSSVQSRAQGKSSTPRMSKFHKQSEVGYGPFRLGLKSWEPCFKILYNDQLLFTPNTFANHLQACIWKKLEDLILYIITELFEEVDSIFMSSV